MSVPLAEATLPISIASPRDIRTTVLPNGLLLLTERMPHLRSVSMGIWVRSGSRDESAEQNGLSHFVEHMVFKGTTSRSARQLAREVDAIGGNLDAFTSKEMIGFTIKSLDEKMEAALDLLSDLVLHPTFTPEDIEREQGVILEEIKMDEDNPDSLVHEIFTQALWKGDPLGRPILGTKKTVSSFDQRTVFDFHASHFTPRNMIFTAAGNLDHDAFVEQADRFFGSFTASADLPATLSGVPTAYPHITLRNKKSLEQVQLCLGVPGLRYADERRYTLFLLNTMLGGGMSSRLFQSIREEQGLAYSIFSESNPFRDTGSLAIYAGTSADKTAQVLALTLGELRRLKEEPVSVHELREAKDQLKANMVLGFESSSSRMSSLARQQMYFGTFFTIDQLTEQIEAVRPEEIQTLARELFQPERIAVTLLGNLGERKVERADLAC